MTAPETIPDNSRLVAELRALMASGKPLYGSFRARPGNRSHPKTGDDTR